MAISYYATKISDNLSKTPEGFLLARNCVLARTGFQSYLVNDVIKDLEPEEVEELGLKGANPNSVINLYRPAEEVFAPSTLASGEGKTFTDEHPEEFVGPNNFREHARGHVRNLHKGFEPLDSGDWPLMGDILITDSEAIDKVNQGIRELSCGYRHLLRKDGEKISQIGLVINHVALVRKGRAGPEARINDAALETTDEPVIEKTEEKVIEKVEEEKKDVAINCNDAIVKTTELKPRREKRVAKTGTIFQRLMGLGIKALANDEDTSPEELAEATREMHEKAKDAESPEMTEKKEEDSKSKDCMPGEVGHEHCSAGECKKGKIMDSPYKAQHDALDRVMSGKKTDADIKELRKVMDEFLKEEEKESEHKEEDSKKEEEEEASTVIEPIEEEDAEADEEKMVKNDAAMALLPLVDKSKSKVLKEAYDSALEGSLDDENTFLKKFKPFVAKSKDSKIIAAFNGEARRVSGQSSSTDGSYANFGAASKFRKAKDSAVEKKHKYSELEEAYAKLREGE